MKFYTSCSDASDTWLHYLHKMVLVPASADTKLGELSEHFAQEIGNGTLGGDFLLDLPVSWGMNNIVGSMETDIALLLIELATLLPVLALLSFIVLVAVNLRSIR